MNQQDFDLLLQKYLSGNCSPVEERVVLGWYQKFAEDSSSQLSLEERSTIEGRIWSNLSAMVQSADNEVTTKKVFHIPRRVYRIAVAACFILMSGAVIYWFAFRIKPQNTFASFKVPSPYLNNTNHEDRPHLIELGDGSRIRLYPGATLSYPDTFQGDTRDVYLHGDAFFDVAHYPKRRFIVHTEAGLLTEELGTSFLIKQFPMRSTVEVSVATGRVRVYRQNEESGTSGEDQGIVLNPNQRAIYNAALNKLSATLVQQPLLLPGPKSESFYFVFDDIPVRDVLDQMEKAYGIEITSEAKIGNCHFTGDISRQGLYEKLGIVCQSIQCTYEIKGTGIVIQGEGCN